MSRYPVSVTVRQAAGMSILDLRGEIDARAEASLKAAFAQAESATAGLIGLNFSTVSYINSTGIALIVGLLAQARNSGYRLVVYGLSDHYQEIFRITRLADYMQIYPDEASLLAAASGA